MKSSAMYKQIHRLATVYVSINILEASYSI